MVKGVYDELGKTRPKNHFTVGIMDDVTHLSLTYDMELDIEPDEVRRSVSSARSDGTVGANKNSIKIIGEDRQLARAILHDSRRRPARSRFRTCASARDRSDRRTW